jgi:hypothetical protein
VINCCRFRQNDQSAVSFSTNSRPIKARSSWPTLSWRCLDNSTSATAQCAGSKRPISTTSSGMLACESDVPRSEIAASSGFTASKDIKFTLTNEGVQLRVSSGQTGTECDAETRLRRGASHARRGTMSQNDDTTVWCRANSTPTALEADKDRHENDGNQTGHGGHDGKLDQPT